MLSDLRVAHSPARQVRDTEVTIRVSKLSSGSIYVGV